MAVSELELTEKKIGPFSIVVCPAEQRKLFLAETHGSAKILMGKYFENSDVSLLEKATWLQWRRDRLCSGGLCIANLYISIVWESSSDCEEAAQLS